MLVALWLHSFVHLFASVDLSEARNNVCSTVSDYALTWGNPRCWYNPNVRSNLRDIVLRNGYPIEKHNVLTEDGYILVLYRIPSSNKDNTKRQPVIIQHGIQGSAAFWVLHDRKSIGLFLVDHGYDVWLPTIRGSAESTGHVNMTTKDPAYWDFGLDELALYDMVAYIEYVAKVTNQKGNIIYIGHSMGTTISYIYASERRRHANEHLRGMISLAPVAFINKIDPLVKRFAVEYGPVVAKLADNLGLKGTGQIPDVEMFLRKYCGTYPVVVLCDALIKLTSGDNPNENIADMVPVFFSYYPTGVSLKVAKMYMQTVLQHGRFGKYNYGIERNRRLYGSDMPPEYNLTNIDLPVFLFVGRYDAVATPADVDVLYTVLNSRGRSYAVKYVLDMAHNDFVIGKHLDEFYTKLLEFMGKLRST
ncbi:unnamed protein product [Acanthoscelides obtectus]|uniref:Lipase n=3 Tax=Acanthoscelides obtectus TaxID=200917 RepID=A0A9P0KDV1_ACAOB|nr:unnamed protein product [Acanthoscelides obtectus]CAK1646746.1 Gastric triacylglycerol lipase [Acanthoscelides obtectus]